MCGFRRVWLIGLLGCYASHEADLEAESECTAECSGQPGSLVPFATTDTNIPLHWRLPRDRCIQVTHDRAFLDAGGNDLNLIVGVLNWTSSACAPPICPESVYREVGGASEPALQVRASAASLPSGPAWQTTVMVNRCSGEILGAEILVRSDGRGVRELAPEDYTRAFGTALGLATPDPDVDSIMSVRASAPARRAITSLDHDALCAMYQPRFCD